MPVMSPEQCRAGRGWLGLTQRDLAAQADVSIQSLIDYEKSRRAAQRYIIERLCKVLERKGLRLMFLNERPVGISLRDIHEDDRYIDNKLTPEQCRAARGWLDWRQQDLAMSSGVGLSAIRDFENKFARRGRRYDLSTRTMNGLLDGFTKYGLHFMFGEQLRPQGIQFDPQEEDGEKRLVA